MKVFKKFISNCLPKNFKKKRTKRILKEVEKILELFCNEFCISSLSEFKNVLHLFKNFLKNEDKKIEEKLKNIPNPFINGQDGKEYKIEFLLPEGIKNPHFIGLNEIGLTCDFTESRCIVSGTLNDSGEKEVELLVNTITSGTFKQKFSFVINPDPKKLWKDLPVPDGIEYPKSNIDSSCIWREQNDGQPQIYMVAASKRGRSHANEGKPRDDDFALRYCPESDWYILAVADGAGSAEFSRKGSEIACNAVADFCEESLKNPNNDFDVFLKEFLEDTEKYKSKLKPKAYEILVRAAYQAYNAIHTEAKSKNRAAKLYATTLLLTICKKLPDESYIILSFNIGDGATGIIFKENDTLTACLNCTPDEGEFGGQTRFVTMSEVFRDPDLINRIHIKKVKDLVAIISMTDGISDAKFETDANLNNEKQWKNLWEHKEDEEDDIKSIVCLDNQTTVKEKLLDWLDFWSTGNHDDRTIAILYSHEQCN